MPGSAARTVILTPSTASLGKPCALMPSQRQRPRAKHRAGCRIGLVRVRLKSRLIVSPRRREPRDRILPVVCTRV